LGDAPADDDAPHGSYREDPSPGCGAAQEHHERAAPQMADSTTRGRARLVSPSKR
jgi:hypothetical protein